MRRSGKLSVVVVVLCLLQASSALAQLSVTTSVSEDTVYVGQRFLFTIAARHNLGGVPIFPPASADTSVFGDLEHIRLVAQGSAPLNGLYRIDSVVYDVTTFALDSAIVPPIHVGFPGTPSPISSSRLLIPVYSVVPADADTIKGMTPPVEFRQVNLDSPPVWPWVLLGLAVAAALVALLYIYMQRKNRVVLTGDSDEPKSSPFEEAMSRLNALSEMDLSTKESEIPYFVELSEALRTYLEHRIEVPALEMSTSEILSAFEPILYKIPGGVPDDLGKVLRLSDLVKFAEYVPPVPDSTAALGTAIDVVQRLEDKQEQLALAAANQEKLDS